jgi:branched-chain amino acid aminotransferase
VRVLAERLLAGDGTPRLAVSVLDRGLQLGDGVFDTLVAAHGVSPAAGRHVARLVAAAGSIGIEVEAALVRSAIDGVVEEVEDCPAIIRTTVTRGSAARGLWPSGPTLPQIIVTAQPWDTSLVGREAALAIATVPRNQHSPLSRIKSLAYLDNILAARQAADAGADDALILNLDGHVACSTIANLFVVRGTRLTTPPVADGCLDGIMRGIILAEAAELGLTVEETSLRPADILGADGAFLTNSVRLMRPVTRLEGAAIPVPPLLQDLMAHLKALFEPKTFHP